MERPDLFKKKQSATAAAGISQLSTVTGLVLDIAGPAVQPHSYVPLMLRRPDERRQLTQKWKFTQEGRLVCAHPGLFVQAKDGFSGIAGGKIKKLTNLMKNVIFWDFRAAYYVILARLLTKLCFDMFAFQPPRFAIKKSGAGKDVRCFVV